MSQAGGFRLRRQCQSVRAESRAKAIKKPTTSPRSIAPPATRPIKPVTTKGAQHRPQRPRASQERPSQGVFLRDFSWDLKSIWYSLGKGHCPGLPLRMHRGLYSTVKLFRRKGRKKQPCSSGNCRTSLIARGTPFVSMKRMAYCDCPRVIVARTITKTILNPS